MSKAYMLGAFRASMAFPTIPQHSLATARPASAKGPASANQSATEPPGASGVRESLNQTSLTIHKPRSSEIEILYRRKFRSQTSDNMDRWKAEMGRVREEKRREEERERVSRKKIQVREKVGKSRNTVFPMIWGSGGSKSRLVKAAGAEPAGQMRDEKLHTIESQNHFQVQMYETPHVRTTFGSWDVEKVHAVVVRSTSPSKNVQNMLGHARTTFGSWDVKTVHAVVARSTFRSQNVQNTTWSDHFWKLRCRKSARCCGTKHIPKSKCTKHTRSGPPSARRCGAKHISKSKCKTPGVQTTFGRSDVVSRGSRKGLCTLSKVSKTWELCSISKNDGRRGTFEEDLQRWSKMRFPWQAQCKRHVHQSC